MRIRFPLTFTLLNRKCRMPTSSRHVAPTLKPQITRVHSGAGGELRFGCWRSLESMSLDSAGGGASARGSCACQAVRLGHPPLPYRTDQIR
jgi:hypothetical protein